MRRIHSQFFTLLTTLSLVLLPTCDDGAAVINITNQNCNVNGDSGGCEQTSTHTVIAGPEPITELGALLRGDPIQPGSLVIWAGNSDEPTARELCPECDPETWFHAAETEQTPARQNLDIILDSISAILSNGTTISHVGTSAPIIAVRGLRGALAPIADMLLSGHDASLEFWPLVEWNDLAISSANALANTRLFSLPATGRGVRAAWVERYGPRKAVSDYRYISSSIKETRTPCVDQADNGNSHALFTIGFAASRKPGVLGGAVDMDIFPAPVTEPTGYPPTCPSAGNGSKYIDQFLTAIEWAITRRVHIVNVSADITSQYCITSFTLMDRYIDRIASNYGVLFSLAAGNEGAGICPGGVGNAYVSWKAWNGLIVGQTNTGSKPQWSDDASANESSWRNFDRLREVPDIAAPGSDISGVSGASSGTSIAAPIATAHAARLMELNGGLLKGRQEAVRAIMIAGAVNHAAEPLFWTSARSGLTDFRYGAGAISGEHEYYMVDSNPNNGGYWYGRLDNSEWGASGLTAPKWSFSAAVGKTIRVALVSNSYSTCFSKRSCAEDPYLNRHYEVWLDGPLGFTVAKARVDRGAAKLLEYLVPYTGNYSVRIRLASERTDSKQKYEIFGLAWLIY